MVGQCVRGCLEWGKGDRQSPRVVWSYRLHWAPVADLCWFGSRARGLELPQGPSEDGDSAIFVSLLEAL